MDLLHCLVELQPPANQAYWYFVRLVQKVYGVVTTVKCEYALLQCIIVSPMVSSYACDWWLYTYSWSFSSRDTIRTGVSLHGNKDTVSVKSSVIVHYSNLNITQLQSVVIDNSIAPPVPLFKSIGFVTYRSSRGSRWSGGTRLSTGSLSSLGSTSASGASFSLVYIKMNEIREYIQNIKPSFHYK